MSQFGNNLSWNLSPSPLSPPPLKHGSSLGTRWTSYNDTMGESVHPSIAVVEDDPDTRALIERWLSAEDYELHLHETGEAFLDSLDDNRPDLLLLDLGLPGIGGLETLEAAHHRDPALQVVVLTSDGSPESAVAAMKQGAVDYLTKPASRDVLSNAARRAWSGSLAYGSQTHTEFPGIVGESRAMRLVYRQLEKLKHSDITVLIHGESGTGKELVARAIHSTGPRGRGPFVPVNCAAIAENLQESEFFGHEKGSFTGADNTRIGRIEMADQGTLFLDEVAELSAGLQAKLLRALQEKSFERVGGNRSIRSDFRLVAATHRNLEDMVATGEFREDLYYRIAVFELELPALRERRDDVPRLVSHMLDRSGSKGTPWSVDGEAMKLLQGYDWPGNVRELHNVIQRTLVVASGYHIECRDLPPKIITENSAPTPNTTRSDVTSLRPPNILETPMTLEELERWAIEVTLKKTEGNLTEAVKRLGISRTTLYRKMKQYNFK